MKRIALWTFGALLVAFLAIQLVPVDRTNPPVETEVAASGEVRSVLRRACYDCHSNETVWPWYSGIAPVSWQIVRDVREGQEALNYSTWNRLPAEEQAEWVYETWEEVAEGVMPPRPYLVLHPEARLTNDDRRILQQWADVSGSEPSGEG